MQDLAIWLVANIPWQLRVAVGHFLPLFLSFYFLWQLRGHLRTKIVLPWLFGAAAAGQLLWLTARLQTYVVDGREGKGILLMVSAAIWLAVFAAGIVTAVGKRIDYRAVFAGVFMPLWIVDVLLVGKVFPGQPDMLYRAVGGAGPLDALFVGPVLAVVFAKLFAWETANYEKWNAWAGRQLGKVKRVFIPRM